MSWVELVSSFTYLDKTLQTDTIDHHGTIQKYILILEESQLIETHIFYIAIPFKNSSKTLLLWSLILPLVKYFVSLSHPPPVTLSSSLSACYVNLLFKLAVSMAQWPHGRIGDQSISAEEVLLLPDEYQLISRNILGVLNLYLRKDGEKTTSHNAVK